MKKNILLLAIMAGFVFACTDKKDDSIAIDPNDTLNLKTPVYATKTVVQTKSDLENTGVKMVGELKSLNQEKGVAATVNLLDLATSSSAKKSATVASAFKTLALIKALSQNKANVNDVVSTLKAAAPATSIITEFEKIAGVYSYNPATDDFDFVANKAGSVKFIFPASKASIAAKVYNDASLEIFKPQVKTGTFKYDTETLTELPTSFGYSLKVKESEVVAFSFTATSV